MSYNQELYQLVNEYLVSQSWKFKADPEDGRFQLGLRIQSRLDHCDIHILVTDEEIKTYTCCPLNASENEYADVVEYITRANYGLQFGGFVFDYSDGQIIFKTVMPCVNHLPSLTDIERFVDAGVVFMQRYGDGLVKNIMGMGDPEEDIKIAENEG